MLQPHSGSSPDTPSSPQTGKGGLQLPTAPCQQFAQVLEATSCILLAQGKTPPLPKESLIVLVEGLGTAWEQVPLSERGALTQDVLTHRRAVIQAATGLIMPQISSLNGSECARLSHAFSALRARNPAFYNSLNQHVGKNLWNFTNSELCAALAGGARIGMHIPDVTFNIVQRATKEQGTLRPEDLLNISSALADLEIRDHRACSVLARRAADLLNEFEPRDIVDLSRNLMIHSRRIDEFHLPACRIVASRNAELSVTQLAQFASVLGRIDYDPSKLRESRLGEVLTARALKEFDSLATPDIAHTARALSRLGYHDQRFFQRVSDRAIKERDSIPARHLAQLIIAFEHRSLHGLPLVDYLAAPMMKAIGQLRPQELAKVANAYSHARKDSTALLTSLANEAYHRIHTFSPDDLTTVALSFARSKIQAHPFWKALPDAAMSHQSPFTSTNLGELAWAYAKSGIPDRNFLPQLAHAVAPMLQKIDLRKPRRTDISSKALSNLAWATATAQVFNPTLIENITRVSTARIHQFTPQGLVNIAGALARFDEAAGRFIPSGPEQDSAESRNASAARFEEILRLRNLSKFFLEACSSEAQTKLALFSPQDLSNLAWAYASLRFRDEDLFKAIAEEFVRRETHPADDGRRFNHLDLSNLAWSFATLNIPHSKLARQIASPTRDLRASMSQRDLASVTWSLAILEPSLVEKLCSPATLDTIKDPVLWLQVYHALLVSGQVSPQQRFERLAESIAHHGKTKRSPFELAVQDDLCNVIGLAPSAIETGAMIAGIEVDFVLNESVVLECDGSSYHLSRGPHGEVYLGADVLQDKIFRLFGFDVLHIRSHEFRGQNREQDLARIREAVDPR